MDTSPVYIEMCSKAEEIQKIGEIHQGYYDIWMYSKCEKDRWYAHPHGWTGVWLPRQDQLQGMMINSDSFDQYYRLFERFEKWWYFGGQSGWTPEQAWLSYVMKEKYGKILWEGKL